MAVEAALFIENCGRINDHRVTLAQPAADQ